MRPAIRVWVGATAIAVTMVAGQAVWPAYEPARLQDPSKRWAVTLSLRGEYDDNIFTTSSNQQSSVKGIIEPQVLVNFPGEQTFVGFRYGYSAVVYENRPGDQIDESHLVDVLFSHTFNPRLTLDMRDTFRRGVEPELVEVQANLPVVTRRRGDYFFNDAKGSVSYELGRRWVMTVRGNWQHWRYDDTEVGLINDRDMYQTGLGMAYALDRRTTVGLNYGYGRIEYSEPGSEDARNSESHSVYVGWVRRFTPQLSLQINGGVEAREFGDGAQQTAPVVDTSISYNYGPESAVTAGFRYSIATTEVGDFRSVDEAGLYARVGHRITPKLRVGLDALYVRDTFENPTPGAGVSAGIEETVLRLALTVSYTFTKWLYGDLAYTYDRVESDITVGDRSFERNRVSLGLRLTY
jgi:hypothetical protein